jgi:hypothetical protein
VFRADCRSSGFDPFVSSHRYDVETVKHGSPFDRRAVVLRDLLQAASATEQGCQQSID